MPRIPQPIKASLLSALMAAPAVVGAPAAEAVDADPAGASPPRPVVLVLDSSGSMAEPAPGGTSRMSVARSAVRRVVRDLPREQELGLRVYGAEVFDRTDAGACRDSSVAVPIGAGTGDAVVDAVAGLRPYGETPIGYALEQAAEDLRAAGADGGSIVLVSDGEPTCDPDPCEVARSLGAADDLSVDVVGLDVDSTTRSSLECIAEAAGGTYYDAADATDLAASLAVVTERAAQAYVPSGQPVAGASSRMDAPVITAGAWRDVVAASDPAGRFYRVQRRIPGSTLHISASVSQAADRTGVTPYLDVRGDDRWAPCGIADVSLAGGGLASAVAVIGTHVWSVGAPLEPGDPCLADELAVQVDWNEDGDRAEMTLELHVIEEPPVLDPGAVPPVPRPADPAPGVMPASAPATPVVPVVGGPSVAAATRLTPGRYSDSLVIGERRVYAVDLDWGQRLSIRIATPRGSSAMEELLAEPGVALSGGILGPGRSADTGDVLLSEQSSLARRDVLTTRPVDWSNRMLPPLEGGPALAGPHYLVLNLQDLSGGDHPSYPVPLRLDVAVDGAPVPPPPYVPEGLGGAEPPTDGPPGRESLVDTGDDRTLLSLVDEPGAAEDEDRAGTVGGVLAFAALGLGALWLLRRRRSRRAGSRRRRPYAATVQAYDPSSRRTSR